jgi:hypothetical protein
LKCSVTRPAKPSYGQDWMINAAAGKHHASLQVVSFQVGHFGQNLGRIEPGGEQVQNVADTNSHPAHARTSAALPGIHGDSFQQVLHTPIVTE